MIRFGHIELYVKDPQVSKKFFTEALGFKVTVEQSEAFVWLEKDDVEILLRPGKPGDAAKRYEESPSGFVLYTNDLDTTAKELSKRGVAFKGTIDNEKCLTFTDPDGHWFQLVNPEDH